MDIVREERTSFHVQEMGKSKGGKEGEPATFVVVGRWFHFGGWEIPEVEARGADCGSASAIVAVNDSTCSNGIHKGGAISLAKLCQA